SSPSQHLIDIDAGPDGTGIGTIDVLAAPSSGSGGAQANVLDTGPDGPHAVDADVATDSSIAPDVNLAGIDLGDLGGVAGAVGGAPIDLPPIVPDPSLVQNLLVV